MKNLFKAFGIFILVSIVASIVAALLAFPFRSNLLVYSYIMQGVALLGMFGASAVIGIHVVEKQNAFEAVGMKNCLGWKNAGICIALALVALPFVGLTEQINKGFVFPEAIEKIMRMMEDMALQMMEMFVNTDSIARLFINIFIIAIIPGFCEELMFRGWIQRNLVKTCNYHVAIWVTAIIFSAIHFQFYGFIPRMLLGAMLGYAYYYTRTLWSSIIMHALNNTVAVVVSFLEYNNYISEEADSMMAMLPYAVPSLILIVGLIYLLHRNNKIEENVPAENINTEENA